MLDSFVKISTHIAVFYPDATLLLCDLPVHGALQQAISTLLLFLNGCPTLAIQQLVALPQPQQGLTAPQLL